MTGRSHIASDMSGIKIIYNLQRKLPDEARAFDRKASSAFSDQRLQTLKFAAPNRFHVTITARVAHLGNVADGHGSHLQQIRLRSTGELDPIPRAGSFSQHDPAVLDPRGRHSF